MHALFVFELKAVCSHVFKSKINTHASGNISETLHAINMVTAQH